MHLNSLVIGDSDASALLTSVLKGIKGKIGEPRYILAGGVDAKKTAGFMQLHAT
jgi:hypothetical protein